MTLITITNELPISFFCGCSQSCQSMISFGTVRLSEMKKKKNEIEMKILNKSMCKNVRLT